MFSILPTNTKSQQSKLPKTDQKKTQIKEKKIKSKFNFPNKKKKKPFSILAKWKRTRNNEKRGELYHHGVAFTGVKG